MGNKKLACLLGGAIGDALGAPVEFLSIQEIHARFGQDGVCGYAQTEGGLARFTDDTQMTLFTVEGLLMAPPGTDPIPSIHRAYMRWLQTQSGRFDPDRHFPPAEGQLLGLPELWHLRAPGNTCLSALRSGIAGSIEHPINHSKGCGGIMRAAPAGLFYDPPSAFDLGCRLAALTHGHPSGYLSAGFLASMVACLILDLDLHTAVSHSLEFLRQYPHHAETAAAVQAALALAGNTTLSPSPEAVERLGGAWVGEEALSISLYCALSYPQDFRAAVLLAINHSGDSDSTGAITGNLLGAALGLDAIPLEWLQPLELRGEIERLADQIQ